MEVPDAGIYQREDWPGPQKGTAAMITRMDRGVGELLQLLEDLGVDERTAVFFSSDNGPHAEGGNDPFFFDSNGPYQGYKRSLHDGGIRVPAIVRWPGRVRPGAVSDLPWYFADFLPTVADIVGLPVPAGVDGSSIAPELLGTGPVERDRFLYWGGTPGRPEAVRWGLWKAVREAPDKPLELFDLATDPGEAADLAGSEPEVVERISEYLLSAVTPLPDAQ